MIILEENTIEYYLREEAVNPPILPLQSNMNEHHVQLFSSCDNTFVTGLLN